MFTDDECLLGTREFAREHGVSQRTVQRWISDGLIFAVRLGRGYKIPCGEVDPRIFGSIPDPEPEHNIGGDDVSDDLDDEEPLFDDGVIEDEDDSDDPCGSDTPAGIPVIEASSLPIGDLRSQFAVYEDALEYAEPIAIPHSIFRRAEDCRYQILIDY